MNDLSEMKVMIVDDTAANKDVLRRSSVKMVLKYLLP